MPFAITREVLVGTSKTQLPRAVRSISDGQLRGNDGGAPLSAVIDDLQQILATVGLQRLQRPVIEDQHIELGEAAAARAQEKVKDLLHYR